MFMSKTMMGSWFSMQRVKAVISITFRFLEMHSWKVMVSAKAENEGEDLSSDGFTLTINTSKIEKNEGKGEVYIRDDGHGR